MERKGMKENKLPENPKKHVEQVLSQKGIRSSLNVDTS